MKIFKAIVLPLLGLFAAGPVSAAENAPLVPYAAFTDSTSGLTVWLWRYGNGFVGTGQMCESCDCVELSQELTQVQIDKSGVVSLRGFLNTIEMSFRGRMNPKRTELRGTLAFGQVREKTITMKACCSDAPSFSAFSSLEEWREGWQR